jgi:hypothetical protein
MLGQILPGAIVGAESSVVAISAGQVDCQFAFLFCLILSERQDTLTTILRFVKLRRGSQ